MNSYQALYRKYRSQTFADLVGQDAIRRALQGAITSGRVAHAYLFSGSRGTGKTSSARLLAKAINCGGGAEGSAEPCNDCDSCRAIMAGTALDLIEIDAASNRGIDEIRDLREKVHLAPAMGKRKVYIIDEAHMLTTEAFNALLKTLEEPPPHVVFILCTTEAQKVPLTVLGRCQHFLFRRHGEEQIAGRLAHITAAEGFEVDPAALALIARTAQGSMRDAVGLLDQVVPLVTGRITLELARELLGIADPALVEGLLELVLEGQAGRALQVLSRTYEGGAELRQVVRSLMELTRDRLVAAIERRDDPLRDRLATVLDTLLHLDGEVRRHAEPRFLVEATLVRLAVSSAPEVAVGAAPRASDRTESSVPQPEPDLESAPSASILVPAEPAAPPGPGVVPEAPAETTFDLKAWQRFLDGLKPNVKGYLIAANPELSGDAILLSFRYGFHHNWVRDHLREVEAMLEPIFGRLKLKVVLREGGPGPPPRAVAPEEHALVQEAVKQLEGRVTRVREMKT